jgi:hypothetical protein
MGSHPLPTLPSGRAGGRLGGLQICNMEKNINVYPRLCKIVQPTQPFSQVGARGWPVGGHRLDYKPILPRFWVRVVESSAMRATCFLCTSWKGCRFGLTCRAGVAQTATNKPKDLYRLLSSNLFYYDAIIRQWCVIILHLAIPLFVSTSHTS